MSCPTISIPSNQVQLSYAQEECFSLLPATPVWKRLEPNSYGTTGSSFETVTRETINSSRQRRRGTTTKESSSVSFEHDFVQHQLNDVLSGFMFADSRSKPVASPTAVTATAYTVPSSTGFLVGRIIFASGFANPANNGHKLITAVTATSVSCTGLVAEASPPAGDSIKVVGHDASTGDISFTIVNGNPTLNATTLNFTLFGFIPGEWIWIGGDPADRQFSTQACNGWARISGITATALTLEGMSGVPVADTGAGKQIRIYVGDVLKNESTVPLQKRKSFCFERSFPNGEFQYINGAVPNNMSLNLALDSKITTNMEFTAATTGMDTVARVGTRATSPVGAIFNTSDSFSRIIVRNELTGQLLTRHVSEMSLSINNNLADVRVLGSKGNVDITAGDFVVEGSMTALYTNSGVINAVKEAQPISISFAVGRENSGWMFDLASLQLGEGMIEVAKDEPVKLPLSAMAVAHPVYDHTLLLQNFSYLPTLAEKDL